jgi:acetylornithine deacetylase
VARIEALCREWGIESRRVGSETGRDSLVVGAADPDLVFAAHVDTIDPPWPAQASVDGDVVHGLGAVDDKGGVVACLLAARELDRGGADLSELGVAFAFPVDEERGGAGSRALALRLRPRYAVALEATGLNTAIAEVGGIEGVVRVQGRSAHGARADLGENAIDRAFGLVAALRSLELEQHRHPLLGACSIQLDSIQAGTEFNTVPDSCRFNVSVSVMPGQDVAETLALIEDLSSQHSAYLELIEVTEPFETPADSPLVEALDGACRETVGRPAEHIGCPAWTDAHNFWAFGHSEAVVFGPGSFDCAHTPEERIHVGEIADCAQIFVDTALRGWRVAVA